MRLLLLLLCAACASAQNAITLTASQTATARSLGVFRDGEAIWQGNRAGIGGGAYFEHWRGNNALVAGGSYTRTNAILFDLSLKPLDTWTLDRYTVDVMYEHRFGAHRIQPYLGAGVFGVVLWGGNAPAHSGVNHSGFDGWAGLTVPAGISLRISPRIALQAGVLTDIAKASTYGDQTYTASQTMTIEPQVGIKFSPARRKSTRKPTR